MPHLPDLQSHAIGEFAEWELVPIEQRTPLQHLAAATDGILTLGNGLTAAGFAADLKANELISQGSIHDGTLSANTLIAATSLYMAEGILDVADGFGATITKTRSPLGRRLDAGTDAIRIPLTTISLVRAGILPKSVAGILVAEKAATIVPSFIANVRGNEPTVASEGKLTALQQRTALLGFLVGATFDQLAIEEIDSFDRKENYRKLAVLARNVGWIATIGSVATTVPSSVKYIRAAVV